MDERFSRTEILFGIEGMEKLKNSRVAIFGIGGVGGYVVEALARSGVGAIDLIDNDIVSISNINRQIIALESTIGMNKVDVAKKRILDINPQCSVIPHKLFFMPETTDMIDFSLFDYVVDAIDTITGKIEIIMQSKDLGIPVISCMGAGNKLDPTRFKISDIYKTSVCPLARVMRREMKNRGIKKLKVLYSDEEVIHKNTEEISQVLRKSIPASNAFVPSVAGLIIASEVVKDLIRS